MKSRFASLLLLALFACAGDGEVSRLSVDVSGGTCAILNRLAPTASVAVDILGEGRCLLERTCIPVPGGAQTFASIMGVLRAHMQPIVDGSLDRATAVAVTVYRNRDCTDSIGCGVGDLDGASGLTLQLLLGCGDLAMCDRLACAP